MKRAEREILFRPFVFWLRGLGQVADSLAFSPGCVSGSTPVSAGSAALILSLARRSRLGKQIPPGVLAVAGASAFCFSSAFVDRRPFLSDIRMDASKGRKPVGSSVEQTEIVSLDDLDPVQDCRRPRRFFFFNDLIAWPA